MKFLIVALMLFSGPAWAQDWIDYEQVLQDNAERVVSETGNSGVLVRRVTVDPGITITCTGPKGAARCEGRDTGRYFPVGCAMQLMSDLTAMMRKCDGFGSPAERAAMDAAFDKVGTYVSRNTVPMQDWSVLRPAMEATSDRTMQGRSCKADTDPDGWGRFLLTGFLSAESKIKIDESLLVPRLPVLDPC